MALNSINSPRREFSARTKREAWQRANGYCEGVKWTGQAYRDGLRYGYCIIGGDAKRCNTPLNRGCHYDHIDPDWFSKDNELDNCQVLCHVCHKAKTAIDIKNIAKSKRIIDKRTGVRKRKGFRGWRKFDGTPVYAKR